MKNIVFGLIIAGVFCVFLYSKKHSNDQLEKPPKENELEHPPGQSKQLTSEKSTANLDSLPTSLPIGVLPSKDSLYVPSQKVTDFKKPHESHSAKIEALYDRIKDIPIDEELKRLKVVSSAFEGAQEKMFPYFYKGKLEDDIKNRIVRLNLSFRNFGPDLDSSACFFLGSLDEFEIQATASENVFQVLRSNDPGYVVINISNKYFLQIFQTSDRPNRRYKSLLTIRNGRDLKKYLLFLEGIDGLSKSGRKPTCFELTLSDQ